MIFGNGVGYVLDQHGLAGPRRRDDEAALPFADRVDQLHDAHRHVVVGCLQPELFFGIQRGQVVEKDLVASDFGRLMVHRLNLQEGEVPLPFLGRPNLPRDRVAGVQVEAADLARRNVNVVRPRQVVVVGCPEEPESVGEGFQNSLSEDHAILFRVRIKNRKNQVLFPKTRGAFDVEPLGNGGQLINLFVFQFL